MSCYIYFIKFQVCLNIHLPTGLYLDKNCFQSIWSKILATKSSFSPECNLSVPVRQNGFLIEAFAMKSHLLKLSFAEEASSVEAKAPKPKLFLRIM